MDGVDLEMMVIAAYDITHDARRARLAALLQSVGDRLQKSVFALQVGEQELTEIKVRTRAIVDPDVDSVFFVSQCAPCWEGLHCIGQAAPPTAVLYWAVL